MHAARDRVPRTTPCPILLARVDCSRGKSSMLPCMRSSLFNLS
ncbi:hypothetical protein DB30_06075 [Enhygromyxa salina]|uniref:Uncharacterized protein n=1 Tax=Enhygromyxa salina TaxID=215803 RepID=A0A0C1ZVF3_9BACT|nr:hypothetical protein DB30_06075 [Enhygromyxa salina]